MSNIIVGIWFLLFGLLGLVSTELPKWLVPFLAIIAGLVILFGASWKRTP